MDKIDAPGLAVNGGDTIAVLKQATAELSNIAAAVDGMNEALHPTMELLEDSHAIHKALVLLREWNGSRNRLIHMLGGDVAG
jgi:hypothetical protein